MFNTNKLQLYAQTLERAYSSIVYSYIRDTFTPCIQAPSTILQWRYHTTSRLLQHAEYAMRINSPQQDINAFLGLLPDVFPTHIRGDDNDTKVAEDDENGNSVPRLVIKDIDQQLCNFLRNQLAIPDDDDTQLGTFYGLTKKQRDAIREQLDRPLKDFYKEV